MHSQGMQSHNKDTSLLILLAVLFSRANSATNALAHAAANRGIFLIAPLHIAPGEVQMEAGGDLDSAASSATPSSAQKLLIR